MPRRVATACALVLMCAAAAPVAAGAAGARYDVTVARTAYGIPHIQAANLRSLGYGYAQALAEDDVCTVAEAYITADGERSKFFGPDKGYVIRGNGSKATNLNSDLFYQRIKDRHTVEKLVDQAPPLGPKPEIKEAIQGYADGWNAWLREQGGSKGIPDPTCRGADWVRPITAMDVYRRFYALALLASTGVAIDGIAGAQPLTGPVDATAAARAVPAGELDRRLGGLGSNAVALGRAATTDGHGLLYGNPHFPWQGSERFYEAHLTIPGKLDVTGGSLLGVPIILIGTTRGMAWSHTVSTARRFVPYQLTLVPGSPTKYVEDGQVKQMTADKVTVDVKTPAGGLAKRTRTLWSSDHGPIFTSLLGLPLFPWTPVNAYAMWDGNADNFGRLLNHFFDMNYAQTVDQVDAIERKYQGIPWVNTIAADTAGNAYYADIGSIPDIPQSKYTGCQTPLGLVTDQLQRLPVLDGTRSSCKPGTEPGAAAPGILSPAQEPSLRRDDFVSNMNDSYWLTNPAQPLQGFSRIIGDERTPRSLRTRMGLTQIRERLNGTDGLPGKGFDLDSLTQVGMADRVYSGEIWRDDLVRGCGSRACDALRAWDLHSDLDSKGEVLWQRFITRLGSVLPGVLPPAVQPFLRPFDPSDPVDTPNGLNALHPAVQLALQEAVADLQDAGLPLDASPRQGQTVTRAGDVIPIHGGSDPAGNFNVITGVWNAKKGGYTDVEHGSSFVQAVHLKPGCPDVRTILTYSESTNPESPHYADQTKLFSRKGWVTVPFCPQQLERDKSAVRTQTADAGSTIVTLREARGSKRPRIEVARPSGHRARITIRVRRGARVVRRIVRRGSDIAVSPRVARGSYRVDVTVGRRTIPLRAKQR